MIAYVTLGTNDLDRAERFYDTLLAELGAKQLFRTDRTIAWGTSLNRPTLNAIKPFDGKPATVGNGVMVALYAGSRETVNRLHAKALELGGEDEGAPGTRGNADMYIGYFRDLDGNKLAAISFK